MPIKLSKEQAINYTMEITKLTKKLRDAYYETEEKIQDYPTIPNGGDIKDSTSNFPAIYLEGTHCCYSNAGCCVNCFYSMYAEHDRKEALEKMNKQVDYILDNFEEMVVSQQYGQVDIDKTGFSYPEKTPIYITISSTGSWFAESEFPIESRKRLLEGLKIKEKEYKRDIVLHIEAHSRDIANREINPEELELLQHFHTKCILGFESSNDISRNVLYNKKLPMDTFLKAVEKLQNGGIDVGAFVIGGLIGLTDIETKEDMLNSVRFLKDKGVFPVLMFSNIQEYTIPDLLHNSDENDRRYHLLEPFSVLDITQEALSILREDNERPYWMVPEPVSGPPVPKNNLFYNREDCSSDEKLNKRMHKALFVLRMNRDINEFNERCNELRYKYSEEYKIYQEKISEENNKATDLSERISDIIEFANENFDKYINKVNQESIGDGEEEQKDVTIKTEEMNNIIKQLEDSDEIGE